MKKWQLLIGASGLGLSCCAGGFSALVKDLINFVSVPKSNIEYLGWTRIALGINNNTYYGLKYFYSSLYYNGQTRWYETTVNASSSTWDWTICSGSWNDCIEFEIPNGGNNIYIVLVSQLVDVDHISLETYTYNSAINHNPKWDEKSWIHNYLKIDYWDGFNYHAHIDFGNKG